MIRKYIKKPLQIQAIKFTGHNGEWIKQNFCPSLTNSMFGIEDTEIKNNIIWWVSTLQGNMSVKPGDYIIKGIAGEFYPCDGKIFEQSYQAVLEEE